MSKETLTVTGLKCCARCQKDHDKLEFEKLAHPIRDLTHWAPCPTNGQPILLRIESDGSEHQAPSS